MKRKFFQFLRFIWSAAPIAFLFAVILFLCFGLYMSIHGIGNGRISVIVPSGRSTTQYNTNAIMQDGSNCIKFISAGDTVRVCDTYRIIRGK